MKIQSIKSQILLCKDCRIKPKIYDEPIRDSFTREIICWKLVIICERCRQYSYAKKEEAIKNWNDWVKGKRKYP